MVLPGVNTMVTNKFKDRQKHSDHPRLVHLLIKHLRKCNLLLIIQPLVNIFHMYLNRRLVVNNIGRLNLLNISQDPPKRTYQVPEFYFLDRLIADLHAHAPLWMADVGDTLANLELASQQLDLLLAEARNAPWRLLYQPSEKQISGELLYEASRNFVFGAADLKSAAASMDQLVKVRGSSLNESAQDFQLVRDNLMNAVKRYEKAQSQLSQVLSAEPPTSE